MARQLYTSKLNKKKPKKKKVKKVAKKVSKVSGKKYIPKYNYKDARWVDIRLKVLSRDKECLNCGSDENLHCHHTYYLGERQPWEYPLEAFETFCKNCHEEYHRKIKGSELVIRGNENIKLKLDWELGLKKPEEIKIDTTFENRFADVRNKAFQSLK